MTLFLFYDKGGRLISTVNLPEVPSELEHPFQGDMWIAQIGEVIAVDSTEVARVAGMTGSSVRETFEKLYELGGPGRVPDLEGRERPGVQLRELRRKPWRD